jgi:hypothetical protein
MGETSLIPGSETQAPPEGHVKRLTFEVGQGPLSSGHISADTHMFPVRVKNSQAQITILVDVELMKRQQEIEEANEEISRRLRG